MKKKLIRTTSLLLVACLLFLSGCQNPGDTPAKTPEEFWARPHEWQSEHLMDGNANENGYYYIKDNSFFRYLDYTTKQSVALCNKVGCKHDDYTCESFIEGFPPYIFFREEKLCLITDDENGMHIFQCDLDATNRESKIILMQDEMEKGNAVQIGDVLINGDDLYYMAVYIEPIEEAGGKRKLPIRAVRHVDLKTWAEEEIFRSSEFIGGIIGADANGVLISKKPEMDAFTKKDLESLYAEVHEEFVVLLTLEEMQELPFEAFYWDKKTGSKLTVYQSNFRATWDVPSVNGSCLYILGRPDGFNNIGLEKMDMRTGEAEWLRHDKENEKFSVGNCREMNGKYYLTIANYTDDDIWRSEVYTKEGFERVEMPFRHELDSVFYEDAHGYMVDRVLEYRPNDEHGSVMDTVFIPREEADKENPECVVLY